MQRRIDIPLRVIADSHGKLVLEIKINRYVHYPAVIVERRHILLYAWHGYISYEKSKIGQPREIDFEVVLDLSAVFLKRTEKRLDARLLGKSRRRVCYAAEKIS